jgi:acyl carrier protein phosphodiesterase
MNYLAHLFLAQPQPEALLGALMGDFVKGPLAGRYPPDLARALSLHRRIDSFTDAHPRVAASRARVSPSRRRFAGIMVDLFYDHFLARDWHRYSPEPLELFSARVYRLLERHEAILPERLRQIAPRMAAFDWLGSYRAVASIHVALDRMSTRLRRENRLHGGGVELEANYAALEADFQAFFPEVMRFAGEEG